MDWWRQWVDLKLMKDLPILVRLNALWVVFMLVNDGNDGSWMSHSDWKRDYDSFSRPQWNLEDFHNQFNFLKLEIHGRSLTGPSENWSYKRYTDQWIGLNSIFIGGTGRLSAWAFFGHKLRDRSGPFLVFCRQFCMAIGQYISKVQAQESSGRLSSVSYTHLTLPTNREV